MEEYIDLGNISDDQRDTKWGRAVQHSLQTVHALVVGDLMFSLQIEQITLRDLLTHGPKEGRCTPMHVLSQQVSAAMSATDKNLKSFSTTAVAQMFQRYCEGVLAVMKLDRGPGGFSISVPFVTATRDLFVEHAKAWPTSKESGPVLRTVAENVRAMLMLFIREHATTAHETAFADRLKDAVKTALNEAKLHVVELSGAKPAAAAAATAAATATAAAAKAAAEAKAKAAGAAAPAAPAAKGAAASWQERQAARLAIHGQDAAGVPFSPTNPQTAKPCKNGPACRLNKLHKESPATHPKCWVGTH
jgi:hypothetical protein